MSAESDLIFPQSDTLLSPDFEEFTKSLLLGNAFQSIAGTHLMGDFENKANLLLPAWPELFCNFNSFSSMIEQEKCFKLDENSKEGQLGFHFYAAEEPNCGMPCNGSVDDAHVDELQRELIAMEPHFEHIELPLSPISRIATRKLHHMNLNEFEGLQVPSSPSLSVEVPSFSSSLMSWSSVDTCNSAGSSPIHSSPDGRKDLISELFAIKDSLEAYGSNSLKKQAAGSDSMGTLGSKFVGTRKKPIPPHMVEEATQCTSMQRSHSSNALRSISSTLGTSDDCGISSFPNQNPSFPQAFSNFSPSHGHLVSDFNMQPSIRSMRKVYSTGDLQAMDELQMSYFMVNLLPREQSNLDESCTRIGCYTLDERRQKLHRYRQKRSERNFSKKIKYACRKTLADSRPRIRGRFARSDEVEELVS